MNKIIYIFLVFPQRLTKYEYYFTHTIINLYIIPSYEKAQNTKDFPQNQNY